MIIDGHIDVLHALEKQWRNFHEEPDEDHFARGHVDLPRLRKGNVIGAFFAVYPAINEFYIKKGVNQWFNLVEDEKNSLMQIKKVEDFEICQNENKIGAILHFEGSGGIDSEFHNLRNYYRLGLRSMGLSWTNINKFATGVRMNEDRGVTPEGKELVKEMNNLGIIIDVSHLNIKSFWDVLDVTNKPLIASHSNSFTLCDDPRNLNDEQIKAIGENDGTIGINFCVAFLSKDKKKEEIAFDIIKEHIDLIVDLAGINHISFGSDFDGATVPDVIQDISFYPDLVEYLEVNGYNRKEMDKITHKNFLRVMKNVWK